MQRVADSSRPSPSGVLIWCGVLHAMTHSFHVVLMPLYLPIHRDLGLPDVAGATSLMSIQMLAYFLPSYGLGILADRYDRRHLLGGGLLINGIGFVGLGLSPSFSWAVVSVIVAGLGGSCYHPAATALIAERFPREQGRAFGLVGVGANVGFLCIPVYAGWRWDRTAAIRGDAGWRDPVIELGFLAVLLALGFLVGTRHWPRREAEAPPRERWAPILSSGRNWVLFLAAALAFSLRDFAGMGMGSLGTLFLQQAHGFTAAATGVALSAIFLAAIVSNPLFGKLSDRHRYGWILVVMTLAGFCVLGFPWLPRWGLLPGLMTYGFFFMACYPMIEAALMDSVPSASRGRLFGLFILISGMLGNFSHWGIGKWVAEMGPLAAEPASYRVGFGALAILIWLSMIGLLCLQMLGCRSTGALREPVRAPGDDV